EAVEAVGVGDVHLARGGGVAERAGRLLRVGPVAGGDDHPPAPGDELAAGLQAKPAVAAGDERDHAGSIATFAGPATRSRAAAGQSGKSKRKPAAASRPGTTRRLFRTSSVSLRSSQAPIAAIQRVAGRPIGI